MNNEKEFRIEICEIGKKLCVSGFTPANDGNISIRISENEVLITPAGVSKGSLVPDMICKVNMKGDDILPNGYVKSSETPTHLRVYRDRPDVKAVIHTHPPYATAFAVAKIPLDKPILPDVIFHIGDVPIVEYGMPSTEELANVVSKYDKKYDALLLENHGVLCFGENLINALHNTERLEYYAKIIFLSSKLSSNIELHENEVKKIVEMKESLDDKTKKDIYF